MRCAQLATHTHIGTRTERQLTRDPANAVRASHDLLTTAARRLTEEERAAVLERARTGGLRTDLVLERARAGGLFDAKKDGGRASCWDLTNLKNVDKKALKDEIELLADLENIVAASQTESLKKAMQAQAEKVAVIDARLRENIKIIAKEEAFKCGYDAPLELKLY